MAKKKNKEKTHDRTSLRKKEILITIIASAVITIVVSSVFHFLTPENEICVHGETGNIFKDCNLGFQITKPNVDWKFHYDFSVNAPKFEYHFPGQSIIDHVLIVRSEYEQVAVLVFDDETDLNLKEFIDKDIEIASNSGLPISITYKLPEFGDNEITLMTEFYNNHEEKKVVKIFKERIIKNDDLVFVIHSQIIWPETIPEKITSEVNEIFNSFQFLL